MAYLVGMLANSMPIPGGFFAVEGGLVGMLLLFGVRPGSTVLAAVVIYRAISLWLPALIGTVAFLSLRREIGKPLRPQPAGSGLTFAEQGAIDLEARSRALLADVAGEVAAGKPVRPQAAARKGRGSRRGAAGVPSSEPGALSGRIARMRAQGCRKVSEKTSIATCPV